LFAICKLRFLLFIRCFLWAASYLWAARDSDLIHGGRNHDLIRRIFCL